MTTIKNCSKCEKGRGTFFCVGCEAYFCKKCHEQHRNDMANQLEEFVENRNQLHRQITEATKEENFSSPLLIEIEDWKTETIRKVEEAAEHAKQRAIELLNSKNKEIKSEFEKFSQELVRLRETQDFLEFDLESLTEAVNQLNQKLKKLNKQPEIELCKEQSDQIEWDTLIYIREKIPATSERSCPEPEPVGKFIIRFVFTSCVA
jgi:vacuolar-type H+-ATPase subunit E/Vma4